ncbi:hypothetical protein G6F31_019777 [Rhizopus arrhizus]|nr:hypothetical protein G6F31_019777 [Rhizopus arrhizus]
MGRNIAAGIVHGAQASLLVGVVATVVAVLIGMLVGLFVRHCAGGDLPAVFRFGDYCRGAGEQAADRPAGARRVHAGQVQRVRRGRHGAGLFAHAHRVCRNPA